MTGVGSPEGPKAQRVRPQPLFTYEQLIEANEAWGCNCGPSALAAIVQCTLEEAREAITGFDARHYTNPTMMKDALWSLGVGFKDIRPVWPDFGLVRIQWEGPWTRPGVPMAARYRFTHWVGTALGADGSRGIFDCNAMANGTGWCSFQDWQAVIVPHILADVARSYGTWHVTHCFSVPFPTFASSRETSPAASASSASLREPSGGAA